ncbi:MAG: hypothetical protein ACM3PT_13235 [Deltaproteobacteria bacterium]
MIINKIYIIIILNILSLTILSQNKELFLEDYYFIRNINSGRTTDYSDISGSPYLNEGFSEAVFYLNDSTAFRLPARYNIYTDQMEYQHNGVSFAISDPEKINRIVFGDQVFYYIKSEKISGYFELVENGKIKLLQKRQVEFIPEEGPKPLVGTITPATFKKNHDSFYIMPIDSDPEKVTDIPFLIERMNDQKTKIRTFIEKEKIKRPKKENLIKIIRYYNTL